MEINLLLSYSSIHKKSYFVQKNRTWCRKGKISEGVCRYKNKMDDTYKNLMMGGFAYVKNYGLRFLFQTTFGTSKTNLVNNIQLSQMNSSSVQKQLKAAGIDTNSKKYKAALSEMMKNGNGAMFTNVQAIKNLMSQYDKMETGLIRIPD